MILNLIVAVDKDTHGIGCKGGIPWKNKEDMQWFKKLTTNNACIMGWTTFISLGKVLPNRLNIVISPDSDATLYYKDDINNINVRNARGLEDAIKIAEDEKYEIAFVIGGGSIYGQYLEKDLIDTAYIDFISNKEILEFDTFFPFDKMYAEQMQNGEFIDNISWDKYVINSTEFNTYVAYHRKRENNNVDKIYLDLLKDISNNGQIKYTRSGETISLFGKQIKFNIQNYIPLLTTKKVYIKGCIHELLWFLKGDTNIKYLVDNNTHIWDDDAYRYYVELIKKHNNITTLTTKYNWDSYKRPQLPIISKEEFIEKVKACEKQHIIIDSCAYIMNTPNTYEYDYQYGDLGPIYGKQWTNKGNINQIDNLIKTLKDNPDDRRLIVNAWNIEDLDRMALPPCHYSFQLYTTLLTYDERLHLLLKKMNTKTYSEDKRVMIKLMNEENIPTRKLSLMWNQRSVDVCLGLPYNILSYGILLYLIAQCVNMVPFELIGNLGDTHIYKNQLEEMYFQVIRNPYKFNLPTIKINENITDIYKFNFEDIKIENYQSYPSIKYILSTGQV